MSTRPLPLTIVTALIQGQVIQGARNRYVLLQPTGQGGFATVWKAQIEGSTQFVAIKESRCNPNIAVDVWIAVAREVATLEQLNKPPKTQNIPTFFEQIPQRDVASIWGYPLIVMEFIPGATAEDHFDVKNVDEDEWINFLLAVLRIVSKLHEKNILHRDLKPNNILIIPDTGEPWVIDYGIAKEISLTKRGPNTAVGTQGFQAPESVRGRIGEFSDVYSIGATVISLFNVLGQEQYWHQVLAKMVDLDETTRYQTCQEVIAHLTTFRITFKKSDQVFARQCHPKEPFSSISAAAKVHFGISARAVISYKNPKNGRTIADDKREACLLLGIEPGDVLHVAFNEDGSASH